MNRTPRLWWTAAVMTLLSGAAGGFFGLLSDALYFGELGGGGPRHRLLGLDAGVLLGAVAGLAVGVVWCWLVVRVGDRARRRGASGKLIVATVGLAILAGMVATALLHLGMQGIYGFRDAPLKHFLGQLFGAPAGFAIGVVGAIAWPPVPSAAPEP